MFKLSFLNTGWHVVTRLGIIILIMVAYSFLWRASLAHTLTDPCASYREQICDPAYSTNMVNNSIADPGRWFQHAFDTLLAPK